MRWLFLSIWLLTGEVGYGQTPGLTIPPPLNDTVIDASLSINSKGQAPAFVYAGDPNPVLLVINNRPFPYNNLQFLRKEDEKHIKHMELIKDTSDRITYSADQNRQHMLQLTVTQKLYKRLKRQNRKTSKNK